VRCTPESVDAALRDLDAQQLRRRREIFGSGVDFCSNDYLGLAAHPDVAAAMANAALAPRTWSTDTMRSTKRSNVNSRNSRVASGLCCSPPVTWPISAWWARSPIATISSSKTV
jgi:hypothetical protein